MTLLARGALIGGYEVLDFVAAGGMAEVYRVRDQRTGDLHALKLLSRDDQRAMFDREYEVMTPLNHPGVARSYRYGSDGGRPWFSMELLRGKPAHTWVKDVGAIGSPNRIRQSLVVAGLTARALDYMHRRGVVHRDVKPANVVVLPDHRVRIVDFGVAWQEGAPDPITGAGAFAGTPGYAAPEGYFGAAVEPSVDLYALGVFMYRLITGKAAFKGENTKKILELQQRGEVPDPRRLVPSVPDQVAALIAELLDPDPAKRPRSGGHVAQRLDLLAGATILPGMSAALFDDDALEDEEAPTVYDVAGTAQQIGWRIGRRPPTGRVARDLYDACGGVPSAVEALVTDLVRSGQVPTDGNKVFWTRHPLQLEVVPALRQDLLGRLGRCNPAQRLVLQAISRVGALPLEILGKLLPNPAAIQVAVAGLEAASLIVADDWGRYHPISPALRTVVLEAPGGLPSTVLEQRLSQVIEQLPPTSFQVRALIRSGRAEQAIAGALAEGRVLAELGRWGEAVELLAPLWELAEAAEPSDALASAYLLYARAAMASGSRDATAPQAVAAARRLAVARTVALEAQLVAAEIHRTIGHYSKYRKDVADALPLSRDIQDDELRAAISLALGRSHLWSGEVGMASGLFQAATQRSAATARTLARVTAALARCEADVGKLDTAEQTARRALEVAAGDPVAASDARSVLAFVERRRGRVSDALRMLAEGIAEARYFEDPGPYFRQLLEVGWCEVDLHRLGPAQECVDELLAALNPTEALHIRLEVSLLEARVQLLSGERRAAAFTLNNLHESAKKAGLAHLAAVARIWQYDADGPERIDPAALDTWFQSRTLGFLGGGDLWTYADACLVYQRNRTPARDPAETFAKLEQALGSAPAPFVRVQLALARAEHARASGNAAARLRACQETGTVLAKMAQGLDDPERYAMRVHPWGHQVRAVLGERGPTNRGPVITS